MPDGAMSSGILKVESLRCCVEHGNSGSSAQMERLFSYIILEGKWKKNSLAMCSLKSEVGRLLMIFFSFSDPLSVVWLSFYWFLSVLL